MLRVDYPLSGRSAFGYTSDLSRTGLYLRGAVKVAVGDALPLALHLRTEAEPVAIDAVVRNVRGGASPGVGLEFTPRRKDALAAVHRFVAEELAGKLEAAIERAPGNAGAVAQVAGYYLETDRAGEAEALYRRALGANSAAPALYEGLGALLLPRVRAGGKGAPALAELEALLDEGLATGETPALRGLRHEAQALRKEAERRERELAREEAERLERVEKERLERLRAALERDAKAIAAEREEVARERAELAAGQEALAAARRSLAEERTALGAERERLAAEAAAHGDAGRVEAERARVADEANWLAEERAKLVEQRRSFEAERTRLAEERKTLEAGRANVTEEWKALEADRAGVADRRKELDEQRAELDRRERELDEAARRIVVEVDDDDITIVTDEDFVTDEGVEPGEGPTPSPKGSGGASSA